MHVLIQAGEVSKYFGGGQHRRQGRQHHRSRKQVSILPCTHRCICLPFNTAVYVTPPTYVPSWGSLLER